MVCSHQLEQAVVKEMAWFRATALSLEKVKTIHLHPDLIAEQLYEQKVRTLYIYDFLIKWPFSHFRLKKHYLLVLFVISKVLKLYLTKVFSPEQILAVEILQHRFNIEKMVKIAEILLTYSDEGEAADLQVYFFLNFM